MTITIVNRSNSSNVVTLKSGTRGPRGPQGVQGIAGPAVDYWVDTLGELSGDYRLNEKAMVLSGENPGVYEFAGAGWERRANLPELLSPVTEKYVLFESRQQAEDSNFSAIARVGTRLSSGDIVEFRREDDPAKVLLTNAAGTGFSPHGDREPGHFSDDVAEGLTLGVQEGNVVIRRAQTITLTGAQASIVMANINRVVPLEPVTLQLPPEVIDVASTSEFNNPNHSNLTIIGAEESRRDITALTYVSGASRNHIVRYTLTNATGIAVGMALNVRASGLVGTGAYKIVAGVWEVVAVNGNDVDVRHALQAAWPALTVTGGEVRPLSTILHYAPDTIGWRLEADLGGAERVAVKGSWDFTTGVREDGAVDGIHIGSAPNTPVTGLTQSKQMNTGTTFFVDVGVYGFANNGLQGKGGRVNAVAFAACGCGWRGIQAGGGAVVMAKKAVSIGCLNGAQAERSGLIEVSDGVFAGNENQGIYAATGGIVEGLRSYSTLNGKGAEAKNGSKIGLDSAQVEGNTGDDLLCWNSQIIAGAGAIIGDVSIEEGGHVSLSGAASRGALRIDNDSMCRLIDTDGKSLWPNFMYLEDGVYNVRWVITSAGDVVLRVDDDQAVRYDRGPSIAEFTWPVRSIPKTFAELPSPSAGIQACITDCNTSTPGALAAGGGANTVLVFADGSNWKVVV